MDAKEINGIIKAQQAFFASGATLSVKFRIAQLKKLYTAIKAHEADITAALESDLGKCRFEGFMCEAGLALTEISYMLRHTRKFAKPRRAHTLGTVCIQKLRAAFPARHRTGDEPVELSVSLVNRAADRCDCGG